MRIDSELNADRERAVSMLAICTSLLNYTLKDVPNIRDVDERFGAGEIRSALSPLPGLHFVEQVRYGYGPNLLGHVKGVLARMNDE